MGGREIKWQHVCAPTGKQEYFSAMLAFLGLLPVPGSPHRFGFFSDMVATLENRCVTSQASNKYQWAISSEALREDICKWGMKINKFAGAWILLGVTGTTSPRCDIYSDKTVYGWGGAAGQVWIAGTYHKNYQCWQSFVTGDR